jgi:tRNA-dihydrouridine synthase C
MGSAGVDLNFGCPAKVVNRHGGGAVLLQDPDQLQRIVEAVRLAVPAHVPVSAKMRLGFDDDRLAEACAQAIEAGGASELVVHARTKAHGYRPPAYWHRVADVRAAVRLPVVANGEVWSVADAHRCLTESGTTALMIGRGAVVDPGLGWAIRRSLGWPAPAQVPAVPAVVEWAELLPHLEGFWQLVCERIEPRARAGRLKQWLNFLRRRFPQAQAAYDEVRTLKDSAAIGHWLNRQLLVAAPCRATSPVVCIEAMA